MNRPLYVVVLNWNGERVIRECLASLGRVPDPPLEIIVVDNGSTDRSRDVVRGAAPGAELIANERNLLFAAGNNVGLKRAMERGAAYVLLLNNDTEVEPLFAAAMIEALERDPSAGIVGPKILCYDDPRRIWYGGADFYPLLWIPRHRNIRKIDGTFSERGGETGWVSGCAMLVRREVIAAIGLLDPSYTIYCEDVDFCLRARRAGWKCLYEPRAVVRHKVSSSSGGGFTAFKLEHRIASTYRLFTRFKPLWWRVLLFPFHFLGFGVLLGALLCTGRFELLRGALRGAGRIVRGDAT
jgi:GT2 family glycosyltransferase